MPSQKIKNTCVKCRFKNEAGSRFCNHCGSSITEKVIEEPLVDAKMEHRDIAHPGSQKLREYLESRILEVYRKETASDFSVEVDPSAATKENSS